MPFKPGKSGNPKGRAKGSYGGRIHALSLLDRFMDDKKRQKALMQSFEEEFAKGPFQFFKNVIAPLLPKESKMQVDHDGIIQWKSLLGDEPGELPRFDAEGRPIPGR
jgi:hypothetical protein